MSKIEILYGVILESRDGGQGMKSFSDKKEALEEVEELVRVIKETGEEGFKVYLSELEYDRNNNRILSDLLNDKSELMISS